MPASILIHRINRLLTTVALLVSATAAHALESMVQAELKSNVYVDGPVIRLGDIALLKSNDEKARQMLAGLEIMKSPRIGYVKLVELDDVNRILWKNFADQQARIHWTNTGRVQVHSRGRSLPFVEVAEQASEYFIQQMQHEQRKLSVGVRGSGKSIKLPHGKLVLVPRMNTTFVSKKMCVWMDAYVDQVFYRSVPVWLDVEIREKVYLASRNIEDRSTVIADDFVLVERDITDFSARHLPAEDFERPLLIKRGVSKGEVLLADNVKQVPAVIGGRKVDMRVSEGGVRIQMQGVAQRDAEIGEVLKIKPLHSDQLVTAKVIGKQLVEVI